MGAAISCPLDDLRGITVNDWRPHRRARSLTALLLVFTAALVACGIRADNGLPADTHPDPDKQPARSPLESVDLPPPGQGGRLAYIGLDGNVYVTTPDLQDTVQVTNNATTFPEGPGLSYHRISWSPDGMLAFASVQRSGDEAESDLFVLGNEIGTPIPLGHSDDHFVIYVYWSPVGCAETAGCRRLAYLIEEAQDIALRLVDVDGEGVDNRKIGSGWPFYLSWSPDGQELLWHTGGARRDNPAASLVRFQIMENRSEALPDEPGDFQAPAWSPERQAWLTVNAQGTLNLLQVVTEDERQTLEGVSDRLLTFAWSPDGRQVAYAARERPEDPFFGPIHVHDFGTGTTRRLTDVGFRITGFFWSPDGEKIGYLTWQELSPTIWNQWRVIHLKTGEDRGYKSFNPSPQWRFVTSSFNQYAQSHRLWSPDSRYLVYAELAGSNPRIWLIDTWSEDGTDAIFVADGTMAFWAWD